MIFVEEEIQRVRSSISKLVGSKDVSQENLKFVTSETVFGASETTHK